MRIIRKGRDIICYDHGPGSEEHIDLPSEERYDLHLPGMGFVLTDVDEGTEDFHTVLHIPEEHYEAFRGILKTLDEVQSCIPKGDVFYAYYVTEQKKLGRMEYEFKLFPEDTLEIHIQRGGVTESGFIPISWLNQMAAELPSKNEMKECDDVVENP